MKLASCRVFEEGALKYVFLVTAEPICAKAPESELQGELNAHLVFSGFSMRDSLLSPLLVTLPCFVHFLLEMCKQEGGRCPALRTSPSLMGLLLLYILMWQ